MSYCWKVVVNLLKVLILVVLEYTQWVIRLFAAMPMIAGLNPCCNGIYSMRKRRMLSRVWLRVLILVVMEYTQWDLLRLVAAIPMLVLILVVMEYTQWGCWSCSSCCIYYVLILVVMEYTQWELNYLQLWKRRSLS